MRLEDFTQGLCYRLRPKRISVIVRMHSIHSGVVSRRCRIRSDEIYILIPGHGKSHHAVSDSGTGFLPFSGLGVKVAAFPANRPLEDKRLSRMGFLNLFDERKKSFTDLTRT